METRTHCAICESPLQNVCYYENMPQKLACVDEPQYNTFPFSVSKCIRCHTHQLDKLVPLNILYSETHNRTSVGKTWETFFDIFCEKIQGLTHNKRVLEIGCPSGKIVRKIAPHYKWYCIVDPNMVPFHETNTTTGAEMKGISAFFDEQFELQERNDTPDIIVHSHLFEHIYEPRAFLHLCTF